MMLFLTFLWSNVNGHLDMQLHDSRLCVLFLKPQVILYSWLIYISLKRSSDSQARRLSCALTNVCLRARGWMMLRFLVVTETCSFYCIAGKLSSSSNFQFHTLKSWRWWNCISRSITWAASLSNHFVFKVIWLVQLFEPPQYCHRFYLQSFAISLTKQMNFSMTILAPTWS